MRTSPIVAALLVANTQALGKLDVIHIIEGVGQGALQAEHLGDLVDCAKSVPLIVADFKEAIDDLKQKSISGTVNALSEVAKGITLLADNAKHCTQKRDLEKLSMLANKLKSYTDPKVMLQEVVKDTLLNGPRIEKQGEDAFAALASGKYQQLGVDLGGILAEIIVGVDQREFAQANDFLSLDHVEQKFVMHMSEYGLSYGTKEEYSFRLAIF